MPAACSARACETNKESVIALNAERVGHVYRTYRYEVSREKIREYAMATGAGEVPEEGEVVAPPTFAACFTVGRSTEMFSDPELGGHWNLVHGSQSYELHRPVRVGDVLACTPKIADITLKGRMDLLTLQIDCVDAATDEPVVTAKSTIIFLNPTEAS